MRKRLSSLLIAIAMLIVTVMAAPLDAFALESKAATLSGPNRVDIGATSDIVVASSEFAMERAFKYKWQVVTPIGTSNYETEIPSLRVDFLAKGQYKITLMEVLVHEQYDDEEYVTSSSAVLNVEVVLPTPSPDPAPQPEQPKAPEEEPAPQFVEENYVPDIVQNDKAQFGKENEGSVPTGAYNFSTYVSPSGFAKGVEKIADKKDAKGNITVYSGKPLTINKELLNTLTAKNMSMTYFFNYGGHLYSVTIPAGVNPALVLDKNGHGGPLYVGWLLGTSRLIK